MKISICKKCQFTKLNCHSLKWENNWGKLRKNWLWWAISNNRSSVGLRSICRSGFRIRSLRRLRMWSQVKAKKSFSKYQSRCQKCCDARLWKTKATAVWSISVWIWSQTSDWSQKSSLISRMGPRRRLRHHPRRKLKRNTNDSMSWSRSKRRVFTSILLS